MAATSKSTGYASRSSKGLSLIEMLTAVMFDVDPKLTTKTLKS
jgi:hypothetical protein